MCVCDCVGVQRRVRACGSVRLFSLLLFEYFCHYVRWQPVAANIYTLFFLFFLSARGFISVFMNWFHFAVGPGGATDASVCLSPPALAGEGTLHSACICYLCLFFFVLIYFMRVRTGCCDCSCNWFGRDHTDGAHGAAPYFLSHGKRRTLHVRSIVRGTHNGHGCLMIS